MGRSAVPTVYRLINEGENVYQTRTNLRATSKQFVRNIRLLIVSPRLLFMQLGDNAINKAAITNKTTCKTYNLKSRESQYGDY